MLDMIALNINNKMYSIEIAPSTPILWVLREQIGLTGTKFGCGISICGACTVHLDGQPIRSCVMPLSAAIDKKITTIEGIESVDGLLHPVQQAWLDEQIPQCGYCQSGQIMSAVALLNANQNPTDDDINTAMQGNICRCGTYNRIRAGIKKAAVVMKMDSKKQENG